MKIREFCKMKKITQEKLAEDLNVDVRTIRRWESSTPSKSSPFLCVNSSFSYIKYVYAAFIFSNVL